MQKDGVYVFTPLKIKKYFKFTWDTSNTKNGSLMSAFTRDLTAQTIVDVQVLQNSSA